MAEGVDYSFARPGGAALAAASKHFAIRYLWYNTASKGINQAEWNDLVSHGLAVGLVYEEDGREALGGHAAGVECARKAEQYRVNNGLPSLPIYFAIDFDAAESQQGVINDFLAGVASVIGLGRTGLYAGYWVIRRAFDAGKIAYGWQTYAWSGGHVEDRAQVYQYSNGHSIGGGAVDFCKNLHDNFGASKSLASGGSGSSAPAGGGNITSRSVKDIQRALEAQGISVGPSGVDGIYGPDTRAAVAEFQKRAGITVDGIYGPVTDAHLFGVGLVVDGIYGPATCGAEQAALHVKVDHIRGPKTISAEQRRTGAKVDGFDGPDTNTHLQQYLERKGYSVGPSGVDGIRGRDTISAMQRALNDGKF